MNQVRLNAGIWRSRVLRFPEAEGLRPTPDRVRQTLFNWLGQDLTGKTCLDLFAGTGALGFEAMSRHARAVTMLELAKAPFQALQHNQRMLGATQATVLHIDALQYLSSQHAQFDVIFCDPPYHKGWLDKLLPVLGAHLAEDGWLYVEAEYALHSTPQWQVRKAGKAGQVYYHLLQAEPA